jgi:hypothetical protein
MDRSDASALADLQMHWDEAYVIALDGDIWSARYRSSAVELRAHTSTELRELIRSDYSYRQKADLIAYDPGDDDDEDGGNEGAESDQETAGYGEAAAGAGPVHPGDSGAPGHQDVEAGSLVASPGERMSL